MKYLAALLALFGWSAADAETLVIIKPSELEQFKADGLVTLDESDGARTIQIDASLMDALKKLGRVRKVKAETSANCGNTNCDIPDAPQK